MRFAEAIAVLMAGGMVELNVEPPRVRRVLRFEIPRFPGGAPAGVARGHTLMTRDGRAWVPHTLLREETEGDWTALEDPRSDEEKTEARDADFLDKALADANELSKEWQQQALGHLETIAQREARIGELEAQLVEERQQRQQWERAAREQLEKVKAMDARIVELTSERDAKASDVATLEKAAAAAEIKARAENASADEPEKNSA